MFHNEKFTHPHLKKSGILNMIAFAQAIGFSIIVFIIPLYLYEIFKSGDIVGQIVTMGALAGIITTIIISLLLSKFSKGILFKLSILITILGVIGLSLFSNFIEAGITRALIAIGGTILFGMIILYLKEISEPEKLADNQGFLGVSINLAWFIGPIFAGFLFGFLETNKNILIENYSFFGNGEYLEYNGTLFFASLFLILALVIFIRGKFIDKHPHLQKNEVSEKNKKHHKIELKFIGEYFQNKYRTMSFLNILMNKIITSGFRFLLFLILLENAGIHQKEIGIFFGIISLPLILIEGFLGKIIKKLKGSINVLIAGYGIMFVLFSLTAFVGYDNIYLFIALFISSFIGFALVEGLQHYQYFEGTNKENEAKFYSLHDIGGAITKLISPVIIGFLITMIGAEKTFYLLPALIGIFFFGLVVYKLGFEKK